MNDSNVTLIEYGTREGPNFGAMQRRATMQRSQAAVCSHEGERLRR